MKYIPAFSDNDYEEVIGEQVPPLDSLRHDVRKKNA